MRRLPVRGIAALIFSCCAAWVHAATPVPPPDAVLPVEPLALLASQADPHVVIDLALKSANAGAAYRGRFDWTQIYPGYWESMGCYAYLSSDGYFKRVSKATKGHGGEIACNNQWSGNLLNWAASSALDGVRLALTGGDRVVDTPDRTVLQRAVLPEDFYRGSHFPDKALTGNLDKLTPLVTGNAEGARATDTVHFNSCLDRLFVGPTATGTCNEPGRDQRYGPGLASVSYAARVEVCTPDEAAVRRTLCFKYPGGNHKPVGAVQAYSERMRFAVFGHLSDDDPTRYGGVLRAPLKHVGPQKTDAAFDMVENVQAEWDADTGVFNADPMSSSAIREGAAAFSGVVNVINRFGRSGARQGDYNRFDAAGELYYESLRYLQGKLPTPEAFVRLGSGNDARKGGLPVYSSAAHWGSQAQAASTAASCQKNHVLVLGDLETSHDRSLPGLSRGASPADFDRGFNGAAYEPDTSYWTSLVGAFENQEALSYSHPSGKTGLATTGNSGPFAFNYKGGAQLTSRNIAAAETGADKGSFGMAGLAYWARTQRIRGDAPEARVQTFVIDVGQGGDGEVRQKHRGSALYLAAKYGGFADANDDGSPFRASGGTGRPDVGSNTEWADGLDADGQPKPWSYFLASGAGQMASAIRRVFAQAAAPSDSGTTGGALSSDTLAKEGASLYVAQSGGRRWAGTLLSYPLVNDVASGGVQRGGKPDWDAGALLTGSAAAKPPLPAREPSSRRIFSLSTAGTGVPFEWAALDPTLRAHLSATPDAEPAASDALSPERLAYLRGDRRKELSAPGGVFRVRDSVMGDVAHSVPLFVGARQGRQAAVYVGANDGMLHAFSASTGEELFAYVPRTLFSRLGSYSSPDYVHRSLVDGSPAVGEMRLANGAQKTVLVSGTGGGATGVFALDVSDPGAFSADRVMWEFSGADDADMGHLLQAPRVMKFRTAAATPASPATYGWFAVVPSGFNNANPAKRTALFLLSLDKPAAAAWVQGINYHKIVLPRPKDKDTVNALGVPGDEAAADGAVRFLYAGDTQGNLWKFDFTGNAPWLSGEVLSFGKTPLMVAMEAGDADARRQPITVQPVVGAGPNGGAIVLFGTGKFVSPDDLSHANYGVQTLYAVHDNGVAIPAGTARTQLQSRTTGVAPGGALPSIAGDAFVYGAFDRKTTSRRGWYFDLPGSPAAGERLVSSPVLADGQLFFNTLMPRPSVCGDNGGGGHSCAVNAMTGLSSGGTCVLAEAGLPGTTHLMQLGDASYGASDALGRRSATRRLSVVHLGGRGGVSTSQPVEGGKVSQVAGRLNWRQVIGDRGAKKS
ncbi:pilus assembly protein [Variovorax sp. KBW07]|uniref:pilus assembly protein n=1 Tax=Variovorax sp. KBW07 TaxID=2153358 RepID=UPI0016239295|nr:PilC/PilY family type IV pilus protein [Variovorax sp. KBW07]